MAFPTGWGRKCAISIPDAQITGSNNDFPVLLTAANFPTEMLNGGANSALNGGGDVRFSEDSAGVTQLACEIVNFVTGGTPDAHIWLKLPSLNSGADKVFYVWYKKAGEIQPAATDIYGRNAVWTNYLRVSHDLLNDVTIGGGTLTNNGTTSAAGLFGEGRAFDGSTQWIDDDFDETQRPYTVQVWFNPDTVTAEQTLWSAEGYLRGAMMGIRSDTKLRSEEWSSGSASGSRVTTLSDPVVGVWQQASISYVSDSDRTIYINGGSSDQSTGTKTGAFGGNVRLGRGIYSPSSVVGYFDGIMCEYRISNGDLSADWIATEYNNQSAPAGFASAGVPEAAEGGGASLVIADNGHGLLSDSATLSQFHLLTVQAAGQATGSDLPVLSQGQTLMVGEGGHGLANGSPALFQGTGLTVDSCILALSSDLAGLLQLQSLVIHNATHGLTGAAPGLVIPGTFVHSVSRTIIATRESRVRVVESENYTINPLNN